jgi:hypothetical protein
MRCLMCNAEMVLIGAVPADATLPGFDTTHSCARLATKLSADCCSLAQNLSRRPELGYERLRSSSANRRPSNRSRRQQRKAPTQRQRSDRIQRHLSPLTDGLANSCEILLSDFTIR